MKYTVFFLLSSLMLPAFSGQLAQPVDAGAKLKVDIRTEIPAKLRDPVPAQPSASAPARLSALGTLFYTPAERQRITQARQKTAFPPDTKRYRLHGVMQSSQGHAVLWIDQRAHYLLSNKLRSDQAIPVNGQIWRVGEILELPASQPPPAVILPAPLCNPNSKPLN